MSETTTRPLSGLSAMKLDELKGVASSMGITGTTKMRKSDLVEAIKARQSGGASAPATSAGASTPAASAPADSAPAGSAPAESNSVDTAAAGEAPVRARASRRVSRPAGTAAVAEPAAEGGEQGAAPTSADTDTAAQAGGDGSVGAPVADEPPA